jgi:hypothetical protein
MNRSTTCRVVYPEARDVGVPIVGSLQRKRRQIETFGPASGSLEQRLDALPIEAELKPVVEELLHLCFGEPQLISAQLVQFAGGSKRGERDARLDPRRDDGPELRGDVRDQPGDAVACRTAREVVEIVQDQGHGVLPDDGVDELWKDDISDGRAADYRWRERPVGCGADTTKRLDCCDQRTTIVVRRVECQPCQGLGRRLGPV